MKITPDQSAPYNIDLQLVKLLSITKEESFSHKTNASIIIKVQLSSKTKSFTKTFRYHSIKEGAMSADVNEIQQNLSHQLSKLLKKIVIDKELNNAITTF